MTANTKPYDLVKRLLEEGFFRVLALDAAEWDVEGGRTLLLALWRYDAEEMSADGAWIHPYYFASQRAYRAASAVMREAQAAGMTVALRDDVRVKPIFCRLPGFAQGRNTVSYLEDVGSRFHVQILLTEEQLPATLHPEGVHALQCGDCQACVEACPTGALDGGSFHREKCLRNWQLSGKLAPEELRAHMGKRLIGCDTCQRCCPHNQAPLKSANVPLDLHALLTAPKEISAMLKESIGANLALPNRVLAQACLLAGCSGNKGLLDDLQALKAHPSPVVREHAAWAWANLNSLSEDAGIPCSSDENTL